MADSGSHMIIQEAILYVRQEGTRERSEVYQVRFQVWRLPYGFVKTFSVMIVPS